MIEHTFIKANDIPDAWHQCIFQITEKGKKYTVNKGSFEGEQRLQFDSITIQIENPYNEPWDLMLPTLPTQLNIPDPVEKGYVEQYMPYLMTDTVQENEVYSYGSRIHDQIVYWTNQSHKNKGTNQFTLQVARPDDYKLHDPPCLREIQIKIIDNQLVFHPIWRSWDLWSGFPANLAGIAVLQNYMSDLLYIESGPMFCYSSGLHIYGYVEELVNIRCGKNIKNS